VGRAVRRATYVDLHRAVVGPTGELSRASNERPAQSLEPLNGNFVVPVVCCFVADSGTDRPIVRRDVRPSRRQDVDSAALGQHRRTPDNHLGGYAPVVRALAADQVPVDA
jgi:hypothetical protein